MKALQGVSLGQGVRGAQLRASSARAPRAPRLKPARRAGKTVTMAVLDEKAPIEDKAEEEVSALSCCEGHRKLASIDIDSRNGGAPVKAIFDLGNQGRWPSNARMGLTGQAPRPLAVHCRPRGACRC